VNATTVALVLYGLSMLAMGAILSTRPPEAQKARHLVAEAVVRSALVGLAPIALVLLLGSAALDSRRKDSDQRALRQARQDMLRHSPRRLDLTE